jgi:hypothetical protein
MLTSNGSFSRAVLRLVMGTVAAISAPVRAQPASFVTIAGFDALPTNSFVGTVTITPTEQVKWFRVVLPRIADPHRYLDIFTSSEIASADTEIALYRADGTLVASDDDDGADQFSALSFGITNPLVPTRLPPAAFGAQPPGVASNGRDGTLVNTLSGGTAATYYIAVTRYNAAFADNFAITWAQPPTTFTTSISVRMHTPSEQIAPTISVEDLGLPLGETDVDLFANASANTTAMSLDLSAVGGPSDFAFSYDSEICECWFAYVSETPLTQLGVFPMTLRARNAIDDVTVRVANLTVRQTAARCRFAAERTLSNTSGTTIYTYDTTQGDVDGPWSASCFNPATPPTGNDVWFRFRPTSDGTLTLSTCNSDTGFAGTQRDTLLGIRSSCGDAVPFDFCADDTSGCGVGTRLSNIPISRTQQYFIAVRAFGTDIANGRLAVTFVPNCDSIDFNQNTLFPEEQDIIDFLSVLAGGPCSDGNTCNDIDFNNDGLFPSDDDLVAFLRVLAGGDC